MASRDATSSEPRSVSHSRSTLARWMGPGDANNAGFVHGGTVMKMCDDTAGLVAVRHSGMRIVTAAMDRMTFIEPVAIGDLLTCVGSVNAAWRSSMEVGVRVEAESPYSAPGVRRHTSTAYLTMVALDENGKPAPIPALVTESETEERRRREAELRRSNRLTEREQILSDRSD